MSDKTQEASKVTEQKATVDVVKKGTALPKADEKVFKPAPKPATKRPTPTPARPAPLVTLPITELKVPAAPASKPPTPTEPVSKPPATQSPASKSPEAEKAVTVADIMNELKSLHDTIADHTHQIAELQEKLSRKRVAVSNGKVQIKDKVTGKVYPSKNNAYQSLLKAGELKALVDKGVFGDVPNKNTFGWYALKRELPDRFEEVSAVKEGSDESKQS